MLVKAERVLPLPVGEQTSAFVPSWMSGIASFCGGVKNPPFSGTNSPNCSAHHSRTTGSSNSKAAASSMVTASGSKGMSPSANRWRHPICRTRR
jgi:hypothetical protein